MSEEFSLIDHEEDEAPETPANYTSAVVEEVREHVGGAPLPCLCAVCPAAIWTVSDDKGRSTAADGATLAQASDNDPWKLMIFCRALHQELATFTPDYQGRALKPARAQGPVTARIVTRCDAYAAELEAWRSRLIH
jgi:hypothetical protein